MKILHINEYASIKGGAEAYLMDLIAQLQNNGHGCQLAYAKGTAPKSLASIEIPSIAHLSGPQITEDLRRLGSFIQNHKPDLIHLHGLWNLGVIRACLNAKPCVMTTHDYRWLCPDSKFYWKKNEAPCPQRGGWQCAITTLKQHCLTRRPYLALQHIKRIRDFSHIMPSIKALIAPSQYAQKRIQQIGYPDQSNHLLPYFCSFSPYDQPRPTPSKKQIGYIGRIAPYKGYQDFLRALSLLPEDVNGLMVGDTDGAKGVSIVKLAQDLGCENKLRLKPWASREEIQGLLNELSVLVFPSIWPETLGIIGLEAMACGVPVVGCKVGGVPDWLHHAVNGFLCAPKNPEKLATAIQQLLNDPVCMQNHGKNGIELIKQQFLPETHLQKLEDIYANCL
ncbi:glycosyltransferase family 4 protein [Verrucomicrobia bacterium]|nr:glycosyltransferase family 4 protein [Verrucomicrobiota bacterium]MDB4664811.1 glycosyltransferase family 4 protein [Verrucomicrobiota bacterium]MDC0268095.1 glycosyltransferase family 4 protein [bacterium]MDG1891752.1 glycosyltransferase family 4 protein [Verrucomicrobiota bacterium]